MNDPHDREYAAAAAALSEHTISPCYLPAVGDRITFQVEGGWDSGRVVSHHRGMLLVETTGDIVEVAPGAVMPF
jgi:hypothetical protein